jgi:hypothetical protein
MIATLKVREKTPENQYINGFKPSAYNTPDLFKMAQITYLSYNYIYVRANFFIF